MQTELEKRLTELSETRGALDGSKRDVEQLKASMAQQKEALGLKEREFAQAYVTERERLQREHETQLRKMSQIEGDKRDALHEITTLTQELHAARNDLGEVTDEKRRSRSSSSSQRALETVKGERGAAGGAEGAHPEAEREGPACRAGAVGAAAGHGRGGDGAQAVEEQRTRRRRCRSRSRPRGTRSASTAPTWST